jgi:hypothetical protein
MEKASSDWVRLAVHGAEPSLYVNTWNVKTANLSLSGCNFSQEVWSILEDIKEDDDYAADTSCFE